MINSIVIMLFIILIMYTILIYCLFKEVSELSERAVTAEETLSKYFPQNCPPIYGIDCLGGHCENCWERYTNILLKDIENGNVIIEDNTLKYVNHERG